MAGDGAHGFEDGFVADGSAAHDAAFEIASDGIVPGAGGFFFGELRLSGANEPAQGDRDEEERSEVLHRGGPCVIPSTMRRIAEDVYLLKMFALPNAINAYLIGDVLLDAGIRSSESKLRAGLQGRTISAHALTHAHADHQGASHAICEAYDVPLWCGEADRAAVESGDLSGVVPQNVLTRFSEKVWAGPAHPVARVLKEGDEVAGFKVLETPGHSPGHLAFWRESDGVLILGDVLNNMNLFTGIPGLNEPPKWFTVDCDQNRESGRKLAALRPSIMCFGHGAPLLDGAKFVSFIESRR